ncbi:hypothetical protein M8Z33_17720 [Streptomyces sp. ZAF1911]|uniref:DUF6879 family protein n=1 Tax=Streptomyces sp. ZAF1911 TaxID=2944129 RepID=UPI00237A97DD|nr:DUF6879 family protein [Streptomyces sp. ZAF1911]MDD9378460.1 hypothetical protein [Streptomyces sp. ZAF1911]
MLSGEEFGRLFETFERSAFRLEILAVYSVEEEREEFERFLLGGDMGPDWDDNPWVRGFGSSAPPGPHCDHTRSGP